MINWILTILILSPIAAAGFLVMPPYGDRRAAHKMSLAFSLVTLALAVVAAVRFFSASQGAGGFFLTDEVSWLSSGTMTEHGLAIDINYRVGIDAISIWLILLSALLMPLAIWSSFSSIRERVREYHILLHLLQAGLLGVFCARDLLLFYVLFEFTLAPLFFLIGIWGGAEKRRAAVKFFLFTLAGSVFMLLAIVVLAVHVHSLTGSISLNLTTLTALGKAGQLSPSLQKWLFLAFAAAFAVKVPLFPVHTWLPLAHTEAPTAGSVALAGVLLKLGTYGFCRICIPILPIATQQLAPFFAVLAIVGILYGALAAWVQKDIKKLIAYSSVSHLGFCVLGLFSLKLAGVSGAVMYMINHGLSTGALFLVVGCIYERFHTRDINALGGLARSMPWMAFFLVFFTLSSIGLPGLNGFVGEFLVLLGTATSSTTMDGLAAGPLGLRYAIPAAGGIILSAVYMLWLCQKVAFGPQNHPVISHHGHGAHSTHVDLTSREIAYLAPLAVACLVIGVYPKPMIKSIQPAVVANILYVPEMQDALKQPSTIGDHPMEFVAADQSEKGQSQ